MFDLYLILSLKQKVLLDVVFIAIFVGVFHVSAIRRYRHVCAYSMTVAATCRLHQERSVGPTVLARPVHRLTL